MHAALNDQLDSIIELSTYCCAALRNLARHEESRGIIVQDGAVQVLVRAYSNSAGSGMTSILSAAVTDWTQLKIAFHKQVARAKGPEDFDAAEERNKQHKMILGAVDQKQKAINRLKTYASEALLNLALHQPSADRLVQEGVAGPLVSMISRTQAMKYEPTAGGGTSTAATKSVEKRHMVNAAGTLAHLARHERIKPVLVRVHAVEPLCELCRGTDLDPRVKCNAMLALSRLAVPRKTHLESRAGMATLVLTALTEGRKGFGAFHNAVPLILQQPLKEALAALQSSKEDEIKFTF